MIEIQPKILIGLAGKAGVGKTTIAQCFVKWGYVQLSYATPLKTALAVLTGLPIEHFIDSELKEIKIPGLDISPRTLMQKIGTECIRNMIHPNFWIWKMRHSISAHSDRDIIIDDIRFENEAQLIRNNGGIVIHLTRSFISPTKHTKHKSERPLEHYKNDIIINIQESPELTAKYIILIYNKGNKNV